MAPRITSSRTRSKRQTKKPITTGNNPQRRNRQKVSRAQVTQGAGGNQTGLQGKAATSATQSGWTSSFGQGAARVTDNTPPGIVRTEQGLTSGGGGGLKANNAIQQTGPSGPRGMHPRLPGQQSLGAGGGPASLRIQPVNVKVHPHAIPSLGGTGQQLLKAGKAGPNPLAILGTLLTGGALQALEGTITDALFNNIVGPMNNAIGSGLNSVESAVRGQPVGSTNIAQGGGQSEGSPASAQQLPQQQTQQQYSAAETRTLKPSRDYQAEARAAQQQQAPQTAPPQQQQAPAQPQVSPQEARRLEFNRRYDEMRKMVEAGTLDEELFGQIGMMMHKHYFGKK